MFKIRQTLLLLAAMMLSVNSLADECSDVQFNDELRDRFPQIEEACLGILDYQGDQWVQLSGKIVSANKRVIALRWKRQDGSYISDIFRTKELDPEFRISVEGRDTKPANLRRGQEINTYVRLGGSVATLMSDDTLETVTATAVAIDFDPAPAEMPTTASLLPMLGLFGVLSLGLGGLMRIFRKRIV